MDWKGLKITVKLTVVNRQATVRLLRWRLYLGGSCSQRFFSDHP